MRSADIFQGKTMCRKIGFLNQSEHQFTDTQKDKKGKEIT